MKAKNRAYRMMLSAFFNNEYIFRHLLVCEDRDKIVENVRLLKKTLEKIFTSQYTDKISDYILEYHMFLQFNDSSTQLFSDLLNKRVSNYVLNYFTGTYLLDEAYDAIKRDSKAMEALAYIGELSFTHGVYVTHIDTFLQRTYSIESLKIDKIEAFIERPFFKRELSHKLANSLLLITDPGDSRFAADEPSKRNKLAFHIDLKNSQFNLEDSIKLMKLIIGMYVVEDPDCNLSVDYSIKEAYWDTFFETQIYRTNKQEIINKLIGLRMWDYVDIEGMKKSEASKKLFYEYGMKVKQECKQCKKKDGYKICNQCSKKYYNLYDIAGLSIKYARICTSGDLKKRPKRRKTRN